MAHKHINMVRVHETKVKDQTLEYCEGSTTYYSSGPNEHMAMGTGGTGRSAESIVILRNKGGDLTG